MSSKRILNIVAWWPTKDKPGNGLFIKEHILSTQLEQNPIVLFLQVRHVIGLLPSIRIHKNEDALTEYHIEVCTPIRRFGVLERMIRRGYQEGIASVRSDFGPIDLVHMHVRDHISKHLIPILYKKQIPHVLTEHFSFYHRGIQSLTAAEQKSETREINEWFNNPLLRHIITVSNELNGILINQFGAPKEKLSMVPNIANDVFTYKPLQPNEEIRIALVAGWRHPKNPLLFFKALTALEAQVQERLIIDFVGHGDQVDSVTSFVQDNLRSMNIHIHGYLAKERIAAILQQSSFLVHPTDQENAPTIIAEALCAGLPVLSMNVNGIPEMINESNGILVDPKNELALVNGLNEMLEKHKSFDRKAISGAALEKYSAGSVGMQLDSILKTVLER